MARLDPNELLLAVGALASAATPFMAAKFRERRARRPKNANEKLYQYYENYIDRLEKQLLAKDVLIEAIYKQMEEQRVSYENIITELETKLKNQRNQLDHNQRQIDGLRKEVGNMQEKSLQAHAHIQKLKKDAPDVLDS